MWKRILNAVATQGQQKQARSIAAFIVKIMWRKREGINILKMFLSAFKKIKHQLRMIDWKHPCCIWRVHVGKYSETLSTIEK